MVRLKYVVPFSSVILLAANQLIGFPLNWPMRAPENRTVHKMTDENGTRYLKRLRFLSFHTIVEVNSSYQLLNQQHNHQYWTFCPVQNTLINLHGVPIA